MQLSSEEIEDILTRVVRWNLDRPKIKAIASPEAKAAEISFICFVGGGTDTYNLIGAFENLEKEILRKIKELRADICT